MVKKERSVGLRKIVSTLLENGCMKKLLNYTPSHQICDKSTSKEIEPLSVSIPLKSSCEYFASVSKNKNEKMDVSAESDNKCCDKINDNNVSDMTELENKKLQDQKFENVEGKSCNMNAVEDERNLSLVLEDSDGDEKETSSPDVENLTESDKTLSSPREPVNNIDTSDKGTNEVTKMEVDDVIKELSKDTETAKGDSKDDELEGNEEEKRNDEEEKRNDEEEKKNDDDEMKKEYEMKNDDKEKNNGKKNDEEKNNEEEKKKNNEEEENGTEKKDDGKKKDEMMDVDETDTEEENKETEDDHLGIVPMRYV